MEVKGYKTFHDGLVNSYGKKFELGKLYSVDGEISFGNRGNGFHFCKNIEDTFRYFDAKEGKVVVAEVTGFPKTVIFNDEYNGFYDMYSAKSIRIDRIINREELINMFLTDITLEHRVIRFIQLYRLTEEEIQLFKLWYASSREIINAILYFQEDQKDVYEKEFVKALKKHVNF